MEYSWFQGLKQSCWAFYLSHTHSYLRPILELMDGKLHRNVEAVQDVASKHQRVLRSINSMDPPLIVK